MQIVKFKPFSYAILVLRIISPFFLFYDPFWVAIFLLFLDLIDTSFWMYSGFLKSKKQYQYIDKFLDWYYLTFLLIFSSQWNLPLLTYLYFFRVLGDIIVLITKKEKLFILFGNYFEPFYQVYAFGITKSSDFLNYLNNNFFLIAAIIVIYKIGQEILLFGIKYENSLFRLGLAKEKYPETHISDS